MIYISLLEWKEIKPKSPFINDKKSLMGWWTEYDGLTLAIINGAGHMVPTDKPHATYEMFSNFLTRK
jgi:carboxypeptidase C (cathepsin A)